MTNRMLVWIALVAGCTQSHSGVTTLAQNDCYTCHKKDYEMTPTFAMQNAFVPDHIANQTMYTHLCADCHDTQSWAVHPESAFPRKTGAHKGVLCVECHYAPDDMLNDHKGANTMCTTSCHTADEKLAGGGTMTTGHSDQTMFSYSSPAAGFTADNFCLSCHPSGVEKPHNESLFPSSHKGAANGCADCHDRTKGSDAAGQNAPCTRCHRNAHNQGNGDPGGCLASGCHLGGGGGGD